MAILSRINLFPIKSFDGISIAESGIVSPGALTHDREFVCTDPRGDHFTGKRTDQMHRLRADFDLAARQVELHVQGSTASRRFSLDGDTEPLTNWLAAYLGEPVKLLQNVTGGFPDDLESPGPTVISVATLETVGSWFGLELDDVRRRFRANLEIDGVEPFWEDRLVVQEGHVVRFKIGNVECHGTNPCQRCPVPSRNPWTGDEIHMFPKTFYEHRRDSLPAWACRERFDHFFRLAVNTRIAPASWNERLHVGDTVKIIGRDKLAPGH